MTVTTNGLTLAEADRRDQRDLAPLEPEWDQGADEAQDAVRALVLPIRETARLALLETIRDNRDLTDLEWRLVRYLQRYEGKIRTYLQISQHLWGTRANPIRPDDMAAEDGYASPYVRHIWVLVHGIRHKLEFDPARPQHLATRRGAGLSWHDAPPGKHDQVDYRALHAEHLKLAAQMRFAFGLSDDPADGAGLPRYPELGPSYPYHEGNALSRRSERT